MRGVKRFLIGFVFPVSVFLSSLGLLGTASVAFWIGFQDLFLPVSLAAQFLGLIYFLAGIFGLAGCASLASLAMPLSRNGWRKNRAKPPTWQIAFAFGGAVAGCYAAATITWYSLGYRTVITWLFAALATTCLFLACIMLPAFSAAWKYIAGSLKGLGISAALLALAAQFWYVSVYTPENTPAAVNTSFSIGAMTGKGASRVVQVDLSMEDTGSVPAVAVGSIIVVGGIRGTGGDATILKVLQPYSNGAWLFPGNVVLFDFLVSVNEPGVDALNFQLTFSFARTSWLTLGRLRTSVPYVKGCLRSSSDRQSQWYVVESHLYSFAQGPKVLYSDYCKYPKNPTTKNIPFVKVGFAGVRNGRLVAIPTQSSRPGLGIITDYQNETILLN